MSEGKLFHIHAQSETGKVLRTFSSIRSLTAWQTDYWW